MHFTARKICAIALVFTLTGCSGFSMPSFDFSMPKLPTMHKFDIQQGNVITQDMVDQLKPGMTRSQVRYIMGTPLISDTFNQNRWDYFYSLQPSKGGEVRERIAIFFDNDQLIGLKGDFFPGAKRPTAVEEEPASLDDTPRDAPLDQSLDDSSNHPEEETTP